MTEASDLQAPGRPETDRRRRLRRVLMPVALVGAVALLISEPCSGELAKTTVVVEVGADVDEVELRLLPLKSTEQLGFFRGRPAGSPPRVRWPLKADAGDYQLSIDVQSGGSSRHEIRRITLRNRATVTIDVTGSPSGGGS